MQKKLTFFLEAFELFIKLADPLPSPFLSLDLELFLLATVIIYQMNVQTFYRDIKLMNTLVQWITHWLFFYFNHIGMS